MRKLVGIIAIAAAIAGCASKPAAEDKTPLNPTAVIERHVTNNGIKGYFPSEGNDTHYVRSNMRRDESAFKGTGTFSGFLVGSHSGTVITRVDRKLLWMVNTEKEEYIECPLQGCKQPVARPARPGEARQPEAKHPEARHEQGCTMRIASSNFAVTPTGKKQSINGFDTDEYQVVWTVNLRDKQARTTTSKVSLDLWTTPLTQPMRDAMNMDAAYARAYAGAMPEVAKMQIIPGDAAKLISSYLANSLTPADRNAFLDASKQMQKIRGYPILTQLTWNMDGNACAPKESAKKAESGTSGAGTVPTTKSGLAAGLAGLYAEKKTKEAVEESAGEPILSFTVEVKQLKVEPRHDSLFEVPAGYQKVQPK